MRTLRFIGIYLLLSLAVVLSWLVGDFIFGAIRFPTSWLGWILLFLLALPIQIIGEWVGDWFLTKNRLAQHIEEKTSSQQFSVLRIFYGLITLLLVFGLIVGLTWAWRSFWF